ncbi:Planctomycete cytochrome C [Anatilimnocola aggregata]|uniref:Planctomycete cytochrome C n=1 Tax=Anatilimnocola aggregata TaxID=2528021 RepID=A0A517YJ42_9BACT|nr:PSD1 and planctomycete cytochrome C domain-containing protein [Anatilimnocola aggregata]QDU30240.1 Planctomycete cytochrome C [Anatilimnocola aggregata]
MSFASPCTMRAVCLSLVVLGSLLAAQVASAAEVAAKEAEFFELQIRPLLVSHCLDCHGDRKQEAKLRLDSREALLAGGDSGPAIVPGDPEKSLLIAAVHYKADAAQMPPKGKLDGDKIEKLTRWVKTGAIWPVAAESMMRTTVAAGDKAGMKIRPQDREFWSFRPVVKPALPIVKHETAAASAIDLFILAQLEAQKLGLAQPAEKRQLIRRVTFDLTGLPPTPSEVAAFIADESPDAYEQLVDRLLTSPRFGERSARLWLDVARFGEDQAHTFAARRYPQGYRYRDWVVQQLNADLPYDQFIKLQIAADLMANPDDKQHLPALGMFACGPVYYGDKNDLDQFADRVDVLTRGFLGLTVACARCHDHKFDPIPTSDYYALVGVFASTDYVETPLVSPAEVEAAQKTLTEKELKMKEKDRPKKYPFAHALVDRSQPKTMKVHVRGNPETLAGDAPRQFLSILSPDEPTPFSQGSGRLELAEAIASPQNPLTARVMVNRLWQQHFGHGLVRTAGNFGALGEQPTHPELLDYLATELLAADWSLKAIHRQIVLSATYQQSANNPAANEVDPENRLWSRYPRRRLDVESWRDAMLSVADQLNLSLGGASQDLATNNNRRRTLYGHVSRHELNPLLRLFDFPDPNITSDQRMTTTVPLQQLFVLNSEFMTNLAKDVSKQAEALQPSDISERITLLYERLYSRQPTSSELELGRQFVSSEAPVPDTQLSRWERYAQALLAANEFLYLD